MLTSKSIKISVILPVYNGEAYLRKSIESILNQTFRDFELIIVDDASVDNSSKIAQEYASHDQRITYLRNEKNLKLPESLNRGFSHAKGEYWTWTSCDNLYLTDAFEKLLAAIEKKSEVGLVYSSMQIINECNEITGFVSAGAAGELIFRNVVGACFLYRKSVAKKVGLYDVNLFLCEDYEYWLRIAQLSFIEPINACYYQYRKHSKSLSYTREKEVIKKGISVQKNYYRFFIKSKRQAALFYAYLRKRDVYNPLRQLYLLIVFFHSPRIFMQEVLGLIIRRFKPCEK